MVLYQPKVQLFNIYLLTKIVSMSICGEYASELDGLIVLIANKSAILRKPGKVKAKFLGVIVETMVKRHTERKNICVLY